MHPTPPGFHARRVFSLVAAIMATALVAVALVASSSSLASAQAVSTGDADDTAGVFLYNAGLDSGQGFLTPPTEDCTGEPGGDPTNITIQTAVDSSPPALVFLGDEEIEVTSFTLGDAAFAERAGGEPDATVADVVTGLSSINDYGTVANGGDDDANFDAETGGTVTLQLHVDGAPAFIIPDGVTSVGTLGTDVADPFGNLDGAEIFIFEDAELSGYTVDLFGPEGLAGPAYTLGVDDYQRNPDTATGADDTLVAIDLDSLPGFDFPYVTFITLTDDGIVVPTPGFIACPNGGAGDTSLEVDAVATRTDVVVTGIGAIDIEKDTNGDQADTGPGAEIAAGDPVTWTYVVTNTGTLELTGVEVIDDQGEAIDCGDGTATIASIAVGASVTCTASGTAVAGPYTNNSTATGQPVDASGAPFGDPVGDADPSAYTGLAQLAELGDFVFNDANRNGVQDANEVGVAGTTVTLWTADAAGAPEAVVAGVAPQVTDATGAYLFTGLDASLTYIVQFEIPVGTAFTAQNSGADDTVDSDTDPATGLTGPIALVGGGSDLTNDAGIFVLVPAVDVEKDTNGDQADTGAGSEILVGDPVLWTYTATNTGELPLADVVITDSVEGAICTIATLAVGASDVCTKQSVAVAGPYTNTADVTAQPVDPTTGLPFGDPVIDDDPSAYVGIPLASVGDFIFVDANEDGLQTEGEVGLAGVVVNLWSVNEAGAPIEIIDTQTTAADGIYGFDELAPNLDYAVQVIPPAGYAVTAAGAGDDDAVDSDADPITGIIPAVTLAPGEENLTLDAGVIPPNPSVDVEKDTNGDQADTGPGETLTTGDDVTWTYVVTNTGNVELTDVSVTDNQVDVVTCPGGNPIPALAVDASVTCTATGTATTGEYTNTATAEGTDPTGATVTDEDRSAYTGELGLAALGDYVWDDLNSNGVQDTDETGIAGVTANLIVDAADGSTSIIDSVTTDDSGLYRFTDLDTTLAYQVQIVPPAGSIVTIGNAGEDDALDSDIDPITGFTPQLTLQPGDNDTTLDAGVAPGLATLGNYLWFDENSDGVQDADESGIADATVTLWNVDENGDIVEPKVTTTTDEDGFYQFTDVDTTRDYRVEFVVDDIYEFTTLGAGEDDVDSDADQTTGITPIISLDRGDEDFTIDAGVLPLVAEIEIVKTTSSSLFTVGDAVTWTYVATNTGTVGLDDVTIDDDREGRICEIATLAVGESQTCTKTGVAIVGNYENTASATGTPDAPQPNGDPVEPPVDTDDSEYEGTEVLPTVLPTATPVPPTATPVPVVPLAVTGSSAGSLAAVATGLVMLGAFLIVAGRRRNVVSISTEGR